MRPRSRSDGIRITKVGAWFLGLVAVVVLAAANTGNNGLYLVLAMMLGMVLLSHFLGLANVRRLGIRLAAHGELFANRVSRLDVEIRNHGRGLPKSILVLAIDGDRGPEEPHRRSAPFLVRYLSAGEKAEGQVEVMLRQRGRHKIGEVHITSLFPLGFFRKGRRYPVDLDLLVFPEIFQPPARYPEQGGRSGDRPTRRIGWGHDLFGLRSFREGDDPRGIHWKQSARTGSLIFKERETEENRRLLIVLDNAVGRLATGTVRRRFERLVSEAATAALDYLKRGYEVALLTRDGMVPFAVGLRQRQAVLETLALIEACDESAETLAAPESQAAHLRLAMEPEGRAA